MGMMVVMIIYFAGLLGRFNALILRKCSEEAVAHMKHSVNTCRYYCCH